MDTAKLETLTMPYPQEGFQTVSPVLADFWLQKYKYPRQRAERAAHTTALALEMESGRFRQKTQISFAKYGSDYFLTNGQHTLKAIIKSGTHQNLSIVVTECNALSEVDDDFSRQDTNLGRQLADSLSAHQVDEHFGVSKSELQKMSSACFYYEYLIGVSSYRGTRKMKTNDTKLNTVMEHGALARSALRLINSNAANHTYLLRRCVLGTVMYTLKEAPELALEFWSGLAADDGLRARDPRKKLLEFLRTSTVGPGTGTRCQVTRVPEHIIVKKIAKAWTFYFEKKEITSLQVKKEGTIATFKDAGIVSLS